MRYYISDLHFHHEALNRAMDRRGFETVEDMNAYMIRQWNAKVRPCDEVVILGDFCFARSSSEVNELLRELHGTKYLIRGNHDRYLEYRRFDTSQFAWVEDYKELNDNNRKVILSHYPIFCYNGQYRMDENGNPKVYMLYGHVHNSFDEYLVNEFQRQTREYRREIRGAEGIVNIPCNMINCFCMFSDYTPLTLDEWIEVDEKRREKIRPEDYLCERRSEQKDCHPEEKNADGEEQ